MYANVGNQLYSWIHYAIACCLLLVVVPRLVFTLPKDRTVESLIAFALRSFFWLVIAAYALIAVKLLEYFSLFVLFGVMALRHSLLSPDTERREQSSYSLAIRFYDWIDGILSVRKAFISRLHQFKNSAKAVKKLSWTDALEYGLLIVILAVSCYIRLYDSLHRAAIAFSDGYVTTQWIKYADNNILFGDGIYPQGFYYFLWYLYKFSGIDALYTMRFTGPLANTLIVFCLYFIVRRLSGNRVAGMVAAVVVGLFGQILGGDWGRQAGTLSQEFGLLLVLPTIYFFHRWMQNNNEVDYRTGLIGAAATGLTHEIGFAYVWLALGALLLADYIHTRRQFLAKLKKCTVAGLISVAISVAPAVLGLLLGKSVHASSLKYVYDTVVVERPPIRALDIAALSGAGLMLLASGAGPKALRICNTSIATLGIVTYIIYEFLGWLTQIDMISTRSVDLWNLTIPILLGMGAAVVLRLLETPRLPRVVWAGAFAVALAAAAVTLPPRPIVTAAKLESDEAVNQYLRISQSFLPKSWTIVYSFREANVLIKGKGYHLYVGSKIGDLDAPPSYFLGKYDPTKPGLTPYGGQPPDTSVGSEVFIFYEKQLFKNKYIDLPDVWGSKFKEYRTREQDMVNLRKWLDEFEQANGPIEVYYNSPSLTVYHIENKEYKDKRNKMNTLEQER